MSTTLRAMWDWTDFLDLHLHLPPFLTFSSFTSHSWLQLPSNTNTHTHTHTHTDRHTPAPPQPFISPSTHCFMLSHQSLSSCLSFSPISTSCVHTKLWDHQPHSCYITCDYVCACVCAFWEKGEVRRKRTSLITLLFLSALLQFMLLKERWGRKMYFHQTRTGKSSATQTSTVYGRYPRVSDYLIKL